ncbi:uncharacterized protein Tco025E_00964 [Trypanosoma conorhini]|uniref:Uncharacterized protein n=1 Tax=Trypanosoma conorhini TaxID=83891 RepID=A0A3R7LEH4_9TRYP|nr:uncharacterized protein Tco025E_00964 [Trypanosoma conorhini]RNF26808.1 hypothetical protein Tco025E_00964 [Trypanosoma conorhini]
MVAKKRWAWYPHLAKRRRQKLAAAAAKASPNNVGLPGKTRAAEAAARSRTTSPLPAAVEDSEAARPECSPQAAATPGTQARGVASVASPAAAPLHATECCLPCPARWYQLGPPLLAQRVRELLLGRPLMTADPAAVSMGASLADEEALSWLFPAVHNGEWFATPWEFIDHCRSISHKLLCEHAPLFPLESSRNTRRRRSPTPPASGSRTGSLGGTEAAVAANQPDRAAPESADAVQQAYYWWFTHLHTTLVQFGQRDWDAYMASRGNAAKPRRLECIGGVWGCYRVFQAALADAVARRLASSSQLVWQALPETAFAMACIVLEVYQRMPHAAAPLHGFRGLGAADRVAAACMHGDQFLWVNDDPTTDATTAAAMASAKGEAALTGREREAVIALAVHLAEVVTGMRHAGRGSGPCAAVDVAAATVEPAPTSAAPGTASAPGLSPHLSLPAHGTAEEEEEERIMALVLWLYLAHAAVRTLPQAAV